MSDYNFVYKLIEDFKNIKQFYIDEINLKNNELVLKELKVNEIKNISWKWRIFIKNNDEIYSEIKNYIYDL